MATTTEQPAALTSSQPSAFTTSQLSTMGVTAANPYDLNANTPAGLATSAAAGMTKADVTGYKPTDVTATGYKTTDWADTEKQTVAGQVQGLIKSESPLMQLAETQAKQQMNQRGLLNTSMAVGAGQEAVIKQALPIAQQDATLYANMAKYNAQIANEQAAFEAAAKNKAAADNAAAANAAASFEAAAKNTASANYSKDLNASVSQMMDIAFKTATSNADNVTKVLTQQIDADTRKYLIDMEATYKNQMQASASANEMYQQITKNIADIMANPDLDVKAKQAAVDQQKGYLNSGMQILSVTSGVKGLDALIDFSGGTGNTVETPTGGTTTPTFKPPAALTGGANFQAVANQFGNTLETGGGVTVDAKGAATLGYKDPITGAASKFTLPSGSYYDPDKNQIVDSTGKQVAVPSGLLSGAMSAEQRRALSPGIQAGDSMAEIEETFGPTGANLAGAKVDAKGQITLKAGTVIPAGSVVVGDKIYKADGTPLALKPGDDVNYRDRITSAMEAGGANLTGATYNADGSVKLKNGTVVPVSAYAKDGVLYDPKTNKPLAIKPADDTRYRERIDGAMGSAGLVLDGAVYNVDGSVKLKTGTVVPAGAKFENGKLVTSTGGAITLKPIDVNGYEDRFRSALDQGGVFMDGATYDPKTGNMKLKSGTVIAAGAYIKDGKLVASNGKAITLNPNDNVNIRNSTNDKWGGYFNMGNVTQYNADGSFKLKSGTVIPKDAVIKDDKVYASASAKTPIALRSGDR